LTTLINNAVPFLVLPLLTQFLAPEEYANVALFSFYLAISNALTGVSIPKVISKHFFDRDRQYLAKIVGNSIEVVFLFSLITLLIILVFYPFLNKYLDLDLLWMALIPLASFSWIIFNLGLTVLRNSKKVLLFTKHQIGNTTINFTFSIFLVVFLLWGWQGRILGIIISYFFSSIIMIFYLKKNGYLEFSLSKGIFKEILSLVFPLIPNSFQSVVISQIGIFFIQFYYTKDLLGVYSIGFQIACAIQLLITTLNLSWSPFLFEQLAKPEKINHIYLTRMYLVLNSVVFLGVLFVNSFSGLILRIMTTPDYFKAKEFIPWFTVGFFFYGLYSFLMPILIKYEKQNYISFVSFSNMFVMIGLNYWLSFLYGYIGIAYAYCFTYFIMFLSLFWKAHKVLPLPWMKSMVIWNKGSE
jgi:O-antigen/teichoic acid export membrane protein